MRRNLLVAVCLIFLAGCRTIDSEHAWNQRPSLPLAHRDSWHGIGGQPQSVLNEWIEIPAAKYASVRNEAKSRAKSLLANKSFVPIPKDQIRIWCDLVLETTATLKPYLVRGLSYDPEYDWHHLYFKSEIRELWIQSISTHGETILTGLNWRLHETPLVVLLESPPDRISVTGHLGGDDVIASDPAMSNSKAAAFYLIGLDYPLK